jgi:hypothetical protein
MGDNVMIYLDDIQHTNPEFLQKFISLCDAQRKIEGVYKGRSRTYDLRGRKVAVVMAGNPYTESGEKFQIPDMLSNRADIYNLGEIIGETSDAFEMSYLENSLTSNPVLSKLASRSQKDVYAIIAMANNEPRDGIELEGNYSLEEINELVSTMQKLMRVRDVILAVNKEYIRSAAQSDDYRTEPSFKLQGSYRNMNRIAEKVVSVMNDDELTSLIVSNYENDAQTLTSGTEANLLKFRELTELMTDEEKERWDDIKRAFRQNVKMRGISSDDKTGQVIAQLGTLSDGLDSIRKAMATGVAQLAEQRAAEAIAEPVVEEVADTSDVDAMVEALTGQIDGLQAGLASISQSLDSGLSKFGDMGSQFGDLTQLLMSAAASPAAGASVVPVSTPAVSAAPESDEPIENRITVVNRLPKAFTGVLREQFELMRAWLEPIHRATSAQSSDIRNLQKRLEDSMKAYERLIGRIDSQSDDKPRRSKKL